MISWDVVKKNKLKKKKKKEEKERRWEFKGFELMNSLNMWAIEVALVNSNKKFFILNNTNVEM